MAYQIVINVTSPTIMTSLETILQAMEGVSIEKKTTLRKKVSITDAIMADKELMASIERGEKDIKEGRSSKVTSEEIKNMLGL